MIEIIFEPKAFRLTLKGHAGATKRGADLVCAAASMLAFTLAERAQQLSRSGGALQASITLEAGDGEICLLPACGHRRQVKEMFATACAGFRLLAKMEPGYVKFRERKSL